MNVVLRTLRAHQWLKNVVVLFPLFSSLQFFDVQSIVLAAKASLAFCAIASCAYIQNDLMDVSHDRKHPVKRTRPFAAGEISLVFSLFLLLTCAAIAILIATAISAKFLMLITSYFLLTVMYSAALKKRKFIDMVFLVIFYMSRILAGAEAIGVTMSPWLFGFATLVFMNLAMLKRVIEIKALSSAQVNLSNFRPYKLSDLRILMSTGNFVGAASVVVFTFYAVLSAAGAGYQRYEILFLAIPFLVVLHYHFWYGQSDEILDDDVVRLVFGGKFSQLVLLALILIFLGAVFWPI